MANDWMGGGGLGGGEDLSMFYRRLAEIEQLQQTDPQEARRQYELLMQDYPGMIEDMQGQQTAGRSLMAEGFDIAPTTSGPRGNPFAVEGLNPGAWMANAGKMMIGGKMANEATEGIATQRGLQQEEKIKTAMAAAPFAAGMAEAEEEKKRQRLMANILRREYT